MNAQEIRELHPNPRVWAPDHDEETEECGYCVGGALGFMLGFEDGFPTTDDVAMYLSMVNGNLPDESAMDYAENITHLNDAERFDSAWDELDYALNYGARA